MSKKADPGYVISVCGVAVVLIWIGIFKFTPTEAKAIQPLLANSFFTRWTYRFADIQTASNVVGVIEIITGLCLILHFKWKKAGLIGGILSVATFLVTLSFLFTTPGSFSRVDGVPVTQFFILKDLMALGISLQVIKRSLSRR